MDTFFSHLLRAYIWLRVAASPFLVGVLAAAGVYYLVRNPVGLVIGGLLCLLGAILGARFANRARREGRLVALATGTRPPSGPDAD